MAFWVSNHFPKRMSYLAWTKAFSKGIGSFDRNDGSMGRTVFPYIYSSHRNQPFIVDIQSSHESVMGGLKWIAWDELGSENLTPSEMQVQKILSLLAHDSQFRTGCMPLATKWPNIYHWILMSIVEVGQFESKILPENFCQLTTEINLFVFFHKKNMFP